MWCHKYFITEDFFHHIFEFIKLEFQNLINLKYIEILQNKHLQRFSIKVKKNAINYLINIYTLLKNVYILLCGIYTT